jgi:hypothetical protein
MKLGWLYELQNPRPWDQGSEHRRVNEAIEQVELSEGRCRPLGHGGRVRGERS